MSIAKVQGANSATTSVTLNGVTAGNLLVVQTSYYRGSGGSGLAETTTADTNGTPAVALAATPQLWASGEVGSSCFYVENANAGTHQFTLENTSSRHTTVTEFSGCATSAFDRSTSNKSTGTITSLSTGTTAATTQDSELVVIGLVLGATGGAADVGFTDPVSGFTTLQKVSNDLSDLGMFHAYKTISSIGTQSATFNWTDSEAAQAAQAAIATFKAAAAATTYLGAASGTSSGVGIAASVGVGSAGSPTTLFSRPYLNVSAGNWLGSSGSQLANDIDESSASDDDYIYDANTGIDGEYRLEPIPDAGTQYGLILHYRPEARWWDSTIVTTLLYGSTTISQWTDSLTANATATTLDKTLTVAEITAIRTASSNASIWTDLRLRHSATQ